MDKIEILEKVGFDLDKAKAVHQWLNDTTTEQPAQPATQDCISIHTDGNGEKWVRVNVFDQDFLIAAHDYTIGDETEFEWQKAMDAMRKIGCSMLNKKQAYIVAAYIGGINAKLREIGGESLNGCYWCSTEYSNTIAWYFDFLFEYIANCDKYDLFFVRPCAAMPNKIRHDEY